MLLHSKKKFYNIHNTNMTNIFVRMNSKSLFVTFVRKIVDPIP